MSFNPTQPFGQPDPRPRDNLGRFLPHDGDTFEPHHNPDDDPSMDADEDEYGFDDDDDGEDYDDGDEW